MLAVASPRHISMIASPEERQEYVTWQMDTTDLQGGDGGFLEEAINPQDDRGALSRAELAGT